MIYGIYGVDTRIKCCPFCGNSNFLQEELVLEGIVRCRKCKASITSEKGLRDAQQKWNKRMERKIK